MKQGLSRSEAGKMGWEKTKHIHKKRREDFIAKYYENPVKCKFCCKIIEFCDRLKKFCNRSCAASYNNLGVRRHGHPAGNCAVCGTKTPSAKNKYCNSKCSAIGRWNKTKEQIKVGSYKGTNDTLKKFLIEERGYKCEICGSSEWLGVKIPLVCDHINGNSDDDSLLNLRLLCNNCDALTPTWKGRNKGSGRLYRRLARMKQKEKLGFSI